MAALTKALMKRTQNVIASQRKKAREYGQALDYGLDDLRILVKAALEQPCPYCRRSLSQVEIQCDHMTPVARGGSFCHWNLQVLCRPCNEAKGIMTHEEFSLLWQALWEMSSEARVDVIRRLRAGNRRFGR